jgi:hypothetical protein
MIGWMNYFMKEIYPFSQTASEAGIYHVPCLAGYRLRCETCSQAFSLVSGYAALKTIDLLMFIL